IVVPTASTTPATAAPGASTTTAAVATTTPACVDKINPRTGVSDCPSRAHLCNNGLYYALMTDQCPKTCNRCGGGGQPTPRPPGIQ
ncbi:unnamed protein product, partial [Strongylus vulgaris]